MVRAMNKLARDKRIQVLTLLCKGVSMRATARATDVSYNTVCALLEQAGRYRSRAVHTSLASRKPLHFLLERRSISKCVTTEVKQGWLSDLSAR